MKAVKSSWIKWVVAKLHGDETASLCEKMGGREVTGWQISTPIFHGTLWPTDFWTPLHFPELLMGRERGKGQIGKTQRKSGWEVPKMTKKDKTEGQVQIGNTRVSNPPCLAALAFSDSPNMWGDFRSISSKNFPSSKMNHPIQLTTFCESAALIISVALPAEPRGEKNFFLCKFWAVKNFKIWWKMGGEKFLVGLRGPNFFQSRFGSFFGSFFAFFKPFFVSI